MTNDAPLGVPVDRGMVVIRFRPTDPASVLKGAEREYRRNDGRYYGASVFADSPIGDESTEDAILRLLEAAELLGMTADRHPKYYVCTSSGELLDRGFRFVKDEDDDEPPEHYTVAFQGTPTLEDVQRFLEPFGPPEGMRR